MSKEHLRLQLEATLRKLEEGSESLLKTRVSVEENMKIKILSEMIREQLNHENINSTVSKAR